MDQKTKDYELITKLWEMLKLSYETEHNDEFWEKELKLASEVDRDTIIAKDLTAAVLNELDRRERTKCMLKKH